MLVGSILCACCRCRCPLSLNEIMEQNGVYQYYTIVSDGDDLTTDNTDVESQQLTYMQDEEEEEDANQVMYLTFRQNEDELLPQEPDVTQESGTETIADKTDAGIQLITIDNGQIYMTEPGMSDENYTTIDGSELLSGVVDNEDMTLDPLGDFKEEEETQIEEPTEELNYREIVLEDGTTAIIDNNLWNTLVSGGLNSALEDIDKKPRKFACMYKGCDKVYTTAHHLTVHIRNHTGVRPYICTEEGCDKAFATGYSLKAHLRTHTGEKPYGCSICMKHFKTSGDLQKHFRTHTGEKPFKCPIEGCGRSFTTSNIRKVHIRSHTGERPYVCEQPDCGKGFASATNYKNHMRIHSGEKPYVCPIADCGKRFTEYSSLYKHNSVHQTLKPYKCCYCGLLCKQESSLRTHKRSIHNIIITEEGTEIFITNDELSNTSLVFEMSDDKNSLLSNGFDDTNLKFENTF